MIYYKYEKKILFLISIIVILFSAASIAYDLLISPSSLIINGTFHNSREMADWLHSFGGWAVLISIIAMIIQAIATPIPLFLAAGANGFIFGITLGVIITLIGAMMGATLAFFLARFLARDFFSKILAHYMPQVNEMSKKSGFRVVFLARLVPILPNSVVSYAAGLSRINFSGFFLASVFGKIPEIVIYTALGHSLEKAEGLFTKITVLIIILSLLYFSLQSKKFLSFCNKNLNQKKENTDHDL